MDPKDINKLFESRDSTLGKHLYSTLIEIRKEKEFNAKKQREIYLEMRKNDKNIELKESQYAVSIINKLNEQIKHGIDNVVVYKKAFDLPSGIFDGVINILNSVGISVVDNDDNLLCKIDQDNRNCEYRYSRVCNGVTAKCYIPCRECTSSVSIGTICSYHEMNSNKKVLCNKCYLAKYPKGPPSPPPISDKYD